MEDPAFKWFLASPLFTFVSELTGEEPEEYTIHSALLASLSPSLKCLVAGNMKEAKERRVTWEADNQTLALFCEFAYTGTYKIARKSEDKTSTTVRRPPGEDEDMADANSKRPSAIATEVLDLGQELPEEEDDDDGDYQDESASETTSVFDEEHESPKDIADDLCPPFPNSGVEIKTNFCIEACTAHVRLINFADYHGVARLVAHSCERLLAQLKEMGKQSHDAVTWLLTTIPVFAASVDDVVAGHVAKNITELWCHQPLRMALEDRPLVMTKIMDKVVGRVR